MGRRAQGFKVRWRGPTRGYYVRFTVDGERSDEPTGIKVKSRGAEAEREGRRIFAQAVTGQRKRRTAASSSPLEELVTQWVAELPTRPVTREQYENYATAHWLTRWSSARDLTTARVETYVRRRLTEVRGKSVRNELSAFRKFVEWLVSQGHLSEAPAIPQVKASVSGVAYHDDEGNPIRRRTRAPELSEDEVRKLLRKLPERSKRGKWPIRARAEFAYETGLRPATLDKLRTPENYRRGATELTLTDDDDKELYGRIVPLSAGARKAIDRVCPKTGLIFGRHRIERYVYPVAQKALPADKARVFTPQHFRSARATHWLDEAAPLTAVQYLLGHKHTSTTARYVRPSLQAARKLVSGS